MVLEIETIVFGFSFFTDVMDLSESIEVLGDLRDEPLDFSDTVEGQGEGVVVLPLEERN